MGDCKTESHDGRDEREGRVAARVRSAPGEGRFQIG
jgi:hypothetical protein